MVNFLTHSQQDLHYTETAPYLNILFNYLLVFFLKSMGILNAIAGNSPGKPPKMKECLINRNLTLSCY